jgi:hypothetical protein
MRESGAATEPAGRILSADLQRILFNAEERRVFLDEFRAHVPPHTYRLIENRITTLQRACERLRAPDATLVQVRQILVEGQAELEDL